MIIRHKTTGETNSLTYHTWRSQHLPKHHETIYDIVDHGSIVLVREIVGQHRKVLHPLDHDHALRMVHKNPETYDFIDIEDSIFGWNPKASILILEAIPNEKYSYISQLKEKVSNISREQVDKVIEHYTVENIIDNIPKEGIKRSKKGDRLLEYYRSCLINCDNKTKSIGLSAYSKELDLTLLPVEQQDNTKTGQMDYNNEKAIKLELYNLYIRIGDNKQMVVCVDNDEIKKIFSHIEQGAEEVFINGRQIEIKDFSTFKIYDFSLQETAESKGATKYKMEQDMRLFRIGWSLRLFKMFGIDVTDKFNVPEPFSKTETPKASDNLFPLDILQSTRGYVLKIGEQACVCYDIGLFDASLVMVRKLIETLIIECYERHGIASKIKDKDDMFFALGDLIGHFLKETEWTLSRNTINSLPRIKKYGDLSAHNRRYSAKKSDLDKINDDLRIVLEDLVHIIDYPNWKKGG